MNIIIFIDERKIFEIKVGISDSRKNEKKKEKSSRESNSNGYWVEGNKLWRKTAEARPLDTVEDDNQWLKNKKMVLTVMTQERQKFCSN